MSRFLHFIIVMNLFVLGFGVENEVEQGKPENVISGSSSSVTSSSLSSPSSSLDNKVQPAIPAVPPTTDEKKNEFEQQKKDHAVYELDYQNASTFFGGLASSLTFVIVSELGDKTFFIAAIMAMRYNRRVVFLGALFALWLMTILSILIGVALPTLFVPETYTHYAAIGLFFIFGARLLKEAYHMGDEGNGEYEEAEAEIDKKDEDSALHDLEAGLERKMEPYILMGFSVHPIFVQVFTMTFLAEWGDRSQIATIALAARGNAYGVTCGGVLGHAFCTLVAVLGGRIAKEQISERTVSFLGGALFIMFGFHEFLYGV